MSSLCLNITCIILQTTIYIKFSLFFLSQRSTKPCQICFLDIERWLVWSSASSSAACPVDSLERACPCCAVCRAVPACQSCSWTSSDESRELQVMGRRENDSQSVRSMLIILRLQTRARLSRCVIHRVESREKGGECCWTHALRRDLVFYDSKWHCACENSLFVPIGCA